MSKDERERRAAKKRREDPNPDRKGKANNVTEENLEEKKDACYHKVKARYDVWPLPMPLVHWLSAVRKVPRTGATRARRKTKLKPEGVLG